MVQSTCTLTWYIVSVYKTIGHGKETDPCYGFLLLGQWPIKLSTTHPHTHKQNPRRHRNVLMHHISHHDRSAGRPWCWHSLRFLKHLQQHTVLSLTWKDTQPRLRFRLLLCHLVPQSHFGPTVCESALYYCFVSQKCFISPSAWPSVCCSIFLSSQ